MAGFAAASDGLLSRRGAGPAALGPPSRIAANVD